MFRRGDKIAELETDLNNARLALDLCHKNLAHQNELIDELYFERAVARAKEKAAQEMAAKYRGKLIKKIKRIRKFCGRV